MIRINRLPQSARKDLWADASVICLLATIIAFVSACGQPNNDQKQKLKSAIEVVSGIDPDSGKQLDEASDLDRFQVNNLPGNVQGTTHMDGKTTKNDDTIQIKKSLFVGDEHYKCSWEFMRLTCTLMHEILHADQEITTGTSLLEKKIEKAKNEVEAYKKSLECATAWKIAILAAKAGAEVPAHFAFLKTECKDKLDVMDTCAENLLLSATTALNFYLEFLADPDRNHDGVVDDSDGVKFDEEESARETGHLANGKTVEEFAFGTDRSVVNVMDLASGEVQDIDTGIAAVTCLMSLSGHESFLIGGTNDVNTPTMGTIHLVLNLNGDNSYESITPLHDLAGLRRPSNFTQHKGNLYVFDSRLRTLFPLLDLSGDGYVDTVAASPTLTIPPNAESEAGFPLYPIMKVFSIDQEMVGMHSLPGLPIDHEGPVAHWTESPTGFTYQGYRFWPEWGVTRPYPIQPLFRGSRTLPFRGVIGSQVALIEVSPNGKSTTLGTSVPDNSGVGILTLIWPMRGPSFTYTLKDLTKGYASLPLRTSPSHPHVSTISPERIEGLEGGTEILLSGLSLGDVSTLTVGGVAATILTKQKTSLSFLAPPLREGGHHEIVLTRDAIQYPIGALDYHVSAFPIIVIIKPPINQFLSNSDSEGTQTVELEAKVVMAVSGLAIQSAPVQILDASNSTVANTLTDANGKIHCYLSSASMEPRTWYDLCVTVPTAQGPVQLKRQVRVR